MYCERVANQAHKYTEITAISIELQITLNISNSNLMLKSYPITYVPLHCFLVLEMKLEVKPTVERYQFYTPNVISTRFILELVNIRLQKEVTSYLH